MLQFRDDDRGNENIGDDKEDINADKAAGKVLRKGVTINDL